MLWTSMPRVCKRLATPSLPACNQERVSKPTSTSTGPSTHFEDTVAALLASRAAGRRSEHRKSEKDGSGETSEHDCGGEDIEEL